MATTPQSKTTKPATSGTYTSPITKKTVNRAGAALNRGNQTFLFDKRNYMWMGIGLLLILIGFALMSGGKSADPHQFNYAEIYSFRRITLAPIVILIGFAVEAYAIMLKRTDHPSATSDSTE